MGRDRWAWHAGFVAFVVVLGVVSVALAGPPVSAARSCPSVVSKTTTLSSNCSGPITVSRSGLTLDCAGFLVSGTATQNGITLGPGIHGVTVKNCALTGFGVGFYLNGSYSNTLQGNTVSGGNASYFAVGFYLNGAYSNTLQGNAVSGENTSYSLHASNANTLAGNTAQGDLTSGFYLEASSSNVLTYNAAMNDALWGFGLAGSSNNTLGYNVAFGSRTGFAVFAGSYNTLTGNNASGSGVGFDVDFSQWNLLMDNRADTNLGDGFVLADGAVFNTLTTNLAKDNGGYGYHDFDAGSGTAGTANTYVADACTGNTVGGSYPFGLCSPQGVPVGAVQDLVSKVNVLESSGFLTKKQADSLLAPLNRALTDLAANRTKGAIRDLRNFESLVGQDVSAGILLPTQAQPMVGEACQVIVFLGGTC